MDIPLRMKIMSGITVQAEDYSADGIENPYRVTAFIPTRTGKPKYRPVQFAFGSMEAATNAICSMTYGSMTLKDYASRLIEPDNKQYL